MEKLTEHPHPDCWRKVEVGSWGEELLGGKPIQSGLYFVKWPDGTITEEIVRKEEKHFTYREMGVEQDGYSHEAYVVYRIYGTSTKIYLKGIEIQAHDAEPPESYLDYARRILNGT